MNEKITPFLWFDTQAEEAARFYTSIFKRSKIGKILRYGEGAPLPKGTVMTVPFELEGQRFTALNGGPAFQFTGAISFVVHCKTQKEVDHYWTRLSEGGKESQCGWLTDRYGIWWQIVPDVLIQLLGDKDAQKAHRVMQAMMGMVKLDIGMLKAASRRPSST
jgi:predicted 3-demethylubiquinone-9 3-methyltransferase (glyoxalase superfamily)